ncbi:uncharacterized protein LOC144862587 [Branchiostoma floridae x Branchiostoma japonicum]
METGPRVVLLHAAEDGEFVRRLVEELMGLVHGYKLSQTDISCQQVTGTPGDVSRAQLTSTLTLGSVKLVVPVISRHLLADQSSLTVGLETAVRNNKPRYVIWLDQNKDDFREFGTLVSRQYPTLEAPARRVQRDRVEETMPGSRYSGMKGIAWDVRDALCRQTGELREPCRGALYATLEFLAHNMNLSAVLIRLEQESHLSPAEVRDIQEKPTPVSRGFWLVDRLMDRSLQEPYDWLVRVLREEGQDFLAEEMEEQERDWERELGIGEQQTAQTGQQKAQRKHFSQQSQATIQKHLRHPGRQADNVTAPLKVKGVILGLTEAGKTSLLNCMMKGQGHVASNGTIGVDIITFRDTNNNVKYEMYDFGGHQIYHYAHRFFLTRQALHILNVDLPGYKSEEFQERVGTWLTSVTSHVFNPAILVVGTKVDLFPPDKAEEMIAAACSSIQRDIQVAESKIQTKLNEEIQLCQKAVDTADGGSNLTEPFYGLTRDDILAKKESLEKLLDGRPKGLLNVQVIPVSSKTFQGIEALCDKMAEMVKDERLFPAARQELPTSWTKLTENIKTSGRPYLHVRDCQDVGAAAGMKESDVLNALSYLHVTGQILFYNHIRGMEDLVFPDPTIILTLFKQIFRHDLPTYLDNKAESLSEHARLQFAEDRACFLQTGRASDSFMKNLLGDNIATFNSLLPLMKHFGLCYSGSVIFPSELPVAQPDEVARCWPEVVPSGGLEISLTIEYSQEPPLGLPETMVSRILSMEQITRRLLTKDTVVVHVGENSEDVMYRHFRTREEIRIRGEPEKAWRQAQTVAKVMEACWDEFPALYFSNRVGSEKRAKSLAIEAVSRPVPAELMRMSWENRKEALPIIRTPERAIRRYHIGKQRYLGPEGIFKIKGVILGLTEAGKTSLLNCMMKGQGHVETETNRTIGVDVTTYHDTKNNVKYEMYDFGGHQIYHYTHRFFLTRQALHILNVDLPGYKSEEFQERVGTWLTSVTSHVFNPAILVVGTKVDLFPPDKAEEMIAAACSSIQRDIQAAESKIQTKLNEEIQLCQKAVDTADDGSDIPGPFYGLTKNDILSKKELLETLFDGRPKGLLNVQVIPVSSKTFQGIEALCDKMAEMVKDERLFPVARQELPTSLTKLSENIKTSGRPYLHVRDCQDVGAAAGMKESDVLNALSYLHVTGQILFYSHIRGMEDLVFPDPTIILTLFKQIFRHDLPAYLDNKAESLNEHGRAQFAEDRACFLQTGRASDSFMKNLLGDNIATFNSLLPLMKHFGLCYSGSVIFPTELPAAQPDEVARCWPEDVPSGEDEISITIEYSQEPPLGLPETMVSRVLSMEQTTRRLLTKDTVVVHVGKNSEDVMYRHFPTREEIWIRGEPEKAWRQAQTVAKVMEACRDEFPALYFSISVGSGETTKSLTIQAVRRHVPGDLLRMSEGNWERPLDIPDVRTPEDVIGNNFIDNQLYRISRAVGEVEQLWTRLGQELGLNRAVLDNIAGRYRFKNAAFQMLKAWRTKTPHGPLYYLPQLEETLQNMGEPDLAADVKGVYKDYRDALPLQETSPEMMGDTQWSLRLPGEGKYLCRRTDLGVVTPYPLHVTYRSANWSDNWQQDQGWMPVGPLFSIQCEDVEGPVDILLPHVLHVTIDTEADLADMRVVHVVGGDAHFLPVSEITLTHISTRFEKGSLFGPVMKKIAAKFYPRNGLCVVFGPRNVMPECQIHVYIASNALIALQTLEDLEALDDYIRWDQDQCALQSGETYRLDVSVRNGEDVTMPTNPEGLIFYDTLETDKFYKKFRVEVDLKKVTSLKKYQPAFKMLLKNAAGTTVCQFITTKGQRLQFSDTDSGESDSGLSSEPASTAFLRDDGHAPGISGRRALRVESDAAGPSAQPDSGSAAGPATHSRRKRKSSRTPAKGKKRKGGDQRGAGVPSKKRKEESSPARVSVLLVSQEWCTSKGGISTINLNVSRMIAAAGAKVYATVLEASPQDERDAQRDGVRLLKPRLDVDSSNKPSLEWLTAYHSVHFPHIPSDISCIVGHVDVTSRAARKIKEERFPQAKLAMFGHVAPEETEHYKSDEKALGVGRKEASIQDDIGKADVVFSVGPSIHRHYDRFLRRNHVTHHIFLPEPSKVFREANVTFEEGKVRKPERVVLSIGRVRNVERLKGHDLAAGSIDMAAQRLHNQYTLRLRVRGIDENDFKDSKRILEDKLRSGRVKPTLLPYGTQEEIRRDMEACHLVLMPSRAEPFGLVGLEAIAAGVPVLVSEHSGLAELIEELSDKLGQPTFRHRIVKMTGETATDADVEKWAERIEDVLKNARSEFAEARDFREKLLASKYWEESHQKFLQACGITDGGSAQAEGGGAEAEDSD